ncbi:MAG: hydroxymethylbilane synthase [Trueperaceae bacterium]|nr:MAG: hydroxymethylbilane synthase [Trueperaceae bacterium]
MSRRTVRLATRGSDLALRQSEFVKAKLTEFGHRVELVLISTQGDRELRPFSQLRGQGFFTKAVQDAVLDGRADIAVHSHKDLPSAPTPGLEIAAVPKRIDPRDVLLARPEVAAERASALPIEPGILVGTSSVRRQRQLLAVREDLRVGELRGNVPTRIEKLRRNDYQAILIAAAGIERLQLDLSGLRVYPLPPELLVPAPAQGALALEVRRDDYELASLLTDLHDVDSYRAIAAERGLMSMLQGGCQLALGAYAEFESGLVILRAWYEGDMVLVEHPTSEGAAMLAFEALGRPDPARSQA